MGKRRALRQFGDVFKRQVVAEPYAAGKKKVKIRKDNLVNLTPITAEYRTYETVICNSKMALFNDS